MTITEQLQVDLNNFSQRYTLKNIYLPVIITVGKFYENMKQTQNADASCPLSVTMTLSQND